MIRRFYQAIPPMVRRILGTIILIVFLASVYFFSFFFIANKIHIHHLSLISIFYILAIVPGLLCFLIYWIFKKSLLKAILPALQGFLAFSIFPYIMLYLKYPGMSAPLKTRMVLVFVTALPQLLAFFALMGLRLKKKLLTGIFFALTVIVGIEVLPLTKLFVGDYDLPSIDPAVVDSKLMKPFGKVDRAFEFKRSITIIENLAKSSQKSPKENLKTITIYMPNLKKYPDVLKLNSQYEDLWPTYSEKKTFFLDTKMDSDGDSLGDFQEAELLTDAYNKDTDGDGINDNHDSDPLNPLIKSDFADIKTVILDTLKPYPDCPLYLIRNNFYNGRGEFSNFYKHVIILDYNQVSKWNVIFGEQYISGVQRSYFGQYVGFGRFLFDITHKICIVGVTQHHGIGADSSGYLFLLINWFNKWQIIAVRLMWM